MTDSSAWVLWTTAAPLRDTLVYWIEGTADTVRPSPPDAALRHRVRLAPLPPNAPVGYRVITGPPRRVTPDRAFRTAPRPGDPEEVTALVFGDSGSGLQAQVDLARRMERLEVDLILHTGDVAYPRGSEYDLTHRHFRVYRDLLSRAPFFPSAGNHDVGTDRGGPFERAFVLPGRGGPEGVTGEPTSDPTPAHAGPGGFHYAFDWGPVHFVGLDSTEKDEDDRDADLRREGRARAWLADDLEAAHADPRTRWIVVFFHHAVFSSARDHTGDASDVELRRALTPLFDRYGVELVLTGHDHHYERSRPLRAGRVDEETPGTVYVVTGGGGGILEWRGVDRREFAAVTALQHHFVLLRAGRDELVLVATARNGSELDRARIRPVPPVANGEPAGARATSPPTLPDPPGAR